MLAICVIGEGEKTTVTLIDGTKKKVSRGDIVEVADDYVHQYLEPYKKEPKKSGQQKTRRSTRPKTKKE